MTKPGATLLVVAQDDPGEVLRLLSAISRVPDESPFDVVVVEDAATEAVREVLGLVEGDVTVLRSVTRAGLARSWDRAAAQSEAPLLVLLEPACVPVDGWLAALCAAFDEPEVVAALPRPIRPDGTVAHRHWWPALAIRRSAFAAVGGFAGSAAAGRAEKASLLEALEAIGAVRDVPAAQVLLPPAPGASST